MSRPVIFLLQTLTIFRGSLLQVCRESLLGVISGREDRQKIADERVRLHHRKQKGIRVESKSIGLRMKTKFCDKGDNAGIWEKSKYRDVILG